MFEIWIYTIDSNKQVFFSLEFVNILLQIEAKALKNASSLLLFSGHSELENGLLRDFEKHENMWIWVKRDAELFS